MVLLILLEQGRRPVPGARLPELLRGHDGPPSSACMPAMGFKGQPWWATGSDKQNEWPEEKLQARWVGPPERKNARPIRFSPGPECPLLGGVRPKTRVPILSASGGTPPRFLLSGPVSSTTKLDGPSEKPGERRDWSRFFQRPCPPGGARPRGERGDQNQHAERPNSPGRNAASAPQPAAAFSRPDRNLGAPRGAKDRHRTPGEAAGRPHDARPFRPADRYSADRKSIPRPLCGDHLVDGGRLGVAPDARN